MTNRLAPLAEDTVGPYYPLAFVAPDEAKPARIAGTTMTAEGTPIRLTGRVLDVNGDLVGPVLLEFWQANARGLFRTSETRDHPDLDPAFDGHARLYCETGAFDVATIMPGPVPAKDGDAPPRAPHVTLSIFSDGISRVATQLFFDGQPLNATDPLLLSLPDVLRGRLIARKDRDDHYAIDIVMRGDGETPFFDDWEG